MLLVVIVIGSVSWFCCFEVVEIRIWGVMVVGGVVLGKLVEG